MNLARWLLSSYLYYCGGTGSTGGFSAFEESGRAAGWTHPGSILSHDAELILITLSEVGDPMPQLSDGSLGGNLDPTQTLLLSPLQDVVFDLVATIRPWPSPAQSDAAAGHVGGVRCSRSIRHRWGGEIWSRCSCRPGFRLDHVSQVLQILTVLHLGNDGIRVERFPHSKLVHSRDSELVLVALDKVGCIVRAGFAFGSDQRPGDPGRLPLFHHVVGNSRTAVIFGWVPPHRALLSCDTSKPDRPLDGSRSICEDTN